MGSRRFLDFFKYGQHLSPSGGFHLKPMTNRPTRERPMNGWSLEVGLDPDQNLYSLAEVLDWGAYAALHDPKAPPLGTILQL